MTNQELEKLFSKNKIDININNFHRVDWKTQDSTDNSILFYKFNSDSSKEQSLFKERIGSAKFLACIVNSSTDFGQDNVFSVSDELFKEAQEAVLDNKYPLPVNISFLGVTGTNGKTTTVDIIKQICINHDLKVLTVGTLGIFLNQDEVENFGLTTPSYIDLRKILAKHATDVDVVAMELSSHALVQGRLGSIKFDSIAWTNISQDHLDFHQTMEEYFEAKMLVFDRLKNPEDKIFLPESQQELGQKIKRNNIEYIADEVSSKNPFFAIKYNRDNFMLAKRLLEQVRGITDIDPDEIVAPAGRFNVIKHKNSFVIIDYAHTPDAILSICREVKAEFVGYNLITVFGCGGDRDRDKRPLMAKAASEFSDMVVLTSDNPRFEDPLQIIEDAKVGLSGNYKIVEDRKTAILEAVKLLNNSVLLIAGKGHEDYIDIKGVKHKYNDKETLMEILNDKS